MELPGKDHQIGDWETQEKGGIVMTSIDCVCMIAA